MSYIWPHLLYKLNVTLFFLVIDLFFSAWLSIKRMYDDVKLKNLTGRTERTMTMKYFWDLKGRTTSEKCLPFSLQTVWYSSCVTGLATTLPIDLTFHTALTHEQVQTCSNLDLFYFTLCCKPQSRMRVWENKASRTSWLPERQSCYPNHQPDSHCSDDKQLRCITNILLLWKNTVQASDRDTSRCSYAYT